MKVTRLILCGMLLLAFAAAPLVASAADDNKDCWYCNWRPDIEKVLPGMNANQRALLDNVRSALRAYGEAMKKTHQLTHGEFEGQLGAPVPDFNKAAQDAKAIFHHTLAAAHDGYIDAVAAFYKSLNPEQIKKLREHTQPNKPKK